MSAGSAASVEVRKTFTRMGDIACHPRVARPRDVMWPGLDGKRVLILSDRSPLSPRLER